jgi:hypothetical protein
VRDAKDVISGVLRLGRRADQKFPIIAKLFEPKLASPRISAL